jgi:hypothetical protein
MADFSVDLQGKVINGIGQPVGGATVDWYTDPKSTPGSHIQSTQTDGSGGFGPLLYPNPNQNPDPSFVAEASKSPEYGSASINFIVNTGGQNPGQASVILTLPGFGQGSAVMTGTVTSISPTEGGRPIPGATIALVGAENASTKTGSDGKYTITVPAGAYRVTVSALKNTTLHTAVGLYANVTDTANFDLFATGALGRPPRGPGGQPE